MTHDLAEYVRSTIDLNTESCEAAAAAIVSTARASGLVRPAGAGHSLAAVLETFFRAGGLAFVDPLWNTEILPFAGARRATAAERRPGLGRAIAEAADITAADTIVVFSNSGVNPYPVEIAEVAKARGATTIGFTSLASNAAAPRRSNASLAELSDIVIDTAVPPGDATWPSEAPVTSPVSSLATTALWATVLRRVHDLEPNLPRWRSANMPGNDGHNDAVLAQFDTRISAL
jgi:uncharacterized phosphosugar-binding protein